ncbi:MAG TPA: glycosyltransferase family 2 protein [Devosiaceae bacterium]|nr:glycosyltransferase family 2 protein [Devosiaceae bacterium]
MLAEPDPKPPVAVICCFLDGKHFLAEAIESVLAQTYPHWTLTLVDDGSTDGATEIARAYAARDPRVRYFEHENHANRGLSASRNAGIAASDGPLVAFIDADDFWPPEKLSEQVAAIQSDPALAMVSGAALYWRSWNGGKDVVVTSGHRSNIRIDPPEALLNVYPLGAAGAPPPSSLLVRREAIERVGGFEAHFSGIYALYEDQAFLCKLYASMPVYFSDRVWVYYRQHGASIMASVRAQGRYHEVRRYFLRWYWRYLDEVPVLHPPIRPAVARALRPYRVPAGLWLLKFGASQRLAEARHLLRRLVHPLWRVL